MFKMLLFLFSEQLENVDVNDEKALLEFYDEKINKKVLLWLIVVLFIGIQE